MSLPGGAALLLVLFDGGSVVCGATGSIYAVRYRVIG